VKRISIEDFEPSIESFGSTSSITYDHTDLQLRNHRVVMIPKSAHGTKRKVPGMEVVVDMDKIRILVTFSIIGPSIRDEKRK